MTWYEFVCLLLLFSGAARANGISHQWPERIMVTEGGTAQLSCAYISNINVAKKWVGSLTWYKDEERGTVCNKCSGFHGRVTTNSSGGFLHQTLQIVNVRMNDTGKYYCKVQIFDKGSYLGKGTEVQVTSRKATKSGGRSLCWQLLEMGVKLIIFLVINIVTVLFIRSQRSRGIVNRNKLI
ncbi:T-cell immunoreceptor with Ig and ITIM domains-like isoform X2 [Mobula hypostoma]|uniref:T-cell immunoreceptor with Ig and ITIM domains-like isoform X2 n=1 Tax=Mobula hypostoma TaxID=723540 RepID=UPI002FC34FF2